MTLKELRIQAAARGYEIWVGDDGGKIVHRLKLIHRDLNNIDCTDLAAIEEAFGHIDARRTADGIKKAKIQAQLQEKE